MVGSTTLEVFEKHADVTTWGHELVVNMAVLGYQLDSVNLVVSSSLNSMIL